MPISRTSDSDSRRIAYRGRLMFAQSWEDPACDLAALQAQPGDTILAITSGGDNVLGFLLTDPQQVIAVDVNPAQTYLLELKKAAFRRLTHTNMLVLLGVRAGDRLARFDRLRDDLSPSARTFWDTKKRWLARGLLTQGAFERVLRHAPGHAWNGDRTTSTRTAVHPVVRGATRLLRAGMGYVGMAHAGSHRLQQICAWAATRPFMVRSCGRSILRRAFLSASRARHR